MVELGKKGKKKQKLKVGKCHLSVAGGSSHCGSFAPQGTVAASAEVFFGQEPGEGLTGLCRGVGGQG